MEHFGLVGLLIGVAALARWFQRAFVVNIPTSPLVFQIVFAVGLLLGAVPLLLGHDDPYAPWAVGVALVYLFLSVTGAQRADDALVKVGDQIPAFNGEDDGGEVFDSSSLTGSRVLLKFFRGHW
jgi:hypothetical protein